MTTLYFIRHATPDRTIGVDATHPLSEKGQRDVALVTDYLQDKSINTVLSSPFKRSYDTVAGFAKAAGLPIEVIEDFRERKVSDAKVIGGVIDYTNEEFVAYAKKCFEDFSYKLPGGECLTEVQARNIAALEEVLTRYEGKNIVVGTHGTALSTIILFYDPSYTFKEWMSMPMPWVAKMTFKGKTFIAIEKVNIE